MAKKAETNNEFFEELKAGLSAAIGHAQGKRKDLRTTTLPRPPKEMSANEIVKVRSQLNVSQAVFARYLNVSTKTVQSWEQGLGKPNGASLKLLSIAKKNPKILLEV
ncbi:MAG: helix-turn-helix domain-containing protein [Acidobacteria bacterium]|nr:helix-turn-helix domain-containing protein [Acidobacteriota bacterium]